MKGIRKASWIGRAARIGLCGIALWFVAQSVSLNDRVVLSNDRGVLIGSAVETGTVVAIETTDGATFTLDRADVAVGEDGAPLLSYGLRSIWRQSRKQLLLLSVVVFLAVPFLQAARLQWMLLAQGIRLKYADSVKLAFAGNFLNFAAPLGSTAGDVFKAYYASLHTSRKTEAATTVFLDRALGLATLVLVVAAVAAIAPEGSRLAPLRWYALGIVGVMGASGLVYLAVASRASHLPTSLLARIPFVDQLRRINRTGKTLAGHKRIVVGAMALTVVLQAFAAGAFLVGAVALGFHVTAADLPQLYAYFSTGEVVKALPGPPQGLGTMELAYTYFFAGFGSTSQIVCAALGIRVVNLICALPGVLITLTGMYRPREVGAGDHETSVPDKAPGGAAAAVVGVSLPTA